jgi:alkylated DNA repair dioxygenase AlkB
VVQWQGSLFGAVDAAPSFDAGFGAITRRTLTRGAWVDHAPNWLHGADDLFVELEATVSWQAPVVRMYDNLVDQPRLHGRVEPCPPVVREMRRALSATYGVAFPSVGANLYRDGRDSVAWHGDRVARDLPESTIAIVSLGGRRRFLLRPKGGGRSIRYELGSGDLLVMGGTCQRTWDHCVPKAAHADARMSVTFRERYV